ncbi:hypothetical protein DLH72_01685 [Candidatus Gracilibacteria bacterium]|nr:MAG: hypothetical protein DLH72_01685 [Candidatus Gracilibacteria bacterium]
MLENNKDIETIDFSDSMVNEKKSINEDVSKNIFNDFNSDISLEAELKNIKEKESKDMFYYLNITGKFLQTFCILFFLGLSFFSAYITIQKSEDFSNQEYLDPICFLFNGDLNIDGGACSSISYNKNLIQYELENLYKEQSKLIVSILPVVYETESFSKTKELSFLVDKSGSKLKVLDIIERFDYFKNDFTGVEKKKLQCYDLTINGKEKFLSMKCEAFSAGYTSEIIGFSGNKGSKDNYLNGTSISVANSFINFLEKNAKKYFLVVDKQKTFESQQILGQDGYTNKTSFNLKLKINF